MANRKITAMTALTAPAESDVLPIVDVSEAAATDKNKKITVQSCLRVRLLVRNQRLALLLSLMTATGSTLLERITLRSQLVVRSASALPTPGPRLLVT